MAFSVRFWQFLILLMVIGTLAIPSQAQDTASAVAATQRQAASHKDREPPDEVELLKLKVEQLQSLVEQQQRVLAAMEKRLKEVEEKNPTNTNGATPASATFAPTNEVGRPAKDAAPPSVAVTPSNPAGDARPATAAGQTEPTTTKAVAGWDESHAFIQSADGNFTTKIFGGGQFDFRGYESGDHPPNSFHVRRVRLGVEGKIARYFDYRVQADFTDARSTLLRDLFIGIHRTDKFQLRFGHFKAPFGQEELMIYGNLDFVERSMADNLVPGRSPGMMAFGILNKGTFEYYVGAFNGKGFLAANNNNTPEGVVRLRFVPWKNETDSWLQGLAFGGAYTQGRNEGGTSVLGQTESRSFTFYTPETINGKVTRANGEFTWTFGPAALRAEYDQVHQERENLGVGDTNLPGVVAKGFTSQFTYLLTGENKAENAPVVPRREVFTSDGGRPGLGAWELKARYTKLQINDGTINSNQAQSLYFGTNWYLNRYVKYMLDFGLERFNDPLRSPKPGDRNYRVLLSRIQLVF
jgi:phosphate-selective porin OprO and OprP